MEEQIAELLDALAHAQAFGMASSALARALLGELEELIPDPKLRSRVFEDAAQYIDDWDGSDGQVKALARNTLAALT